MKPKTQPSMKTPPAAPPLTVAEAAAELGVDPSRVRVLIRQGRLRARQFGARSYAIDPGDLDAVRVRTPGRPPGKFGTGGKSPN